MLFFHSLSFVQLSTSHRTCRPGRTQCNPSGPDVRFPFGLNPSRCSYPGFTLSCNNLRQTILTLPNTAGEFIVQSINYTSQTVYIKDPESCLPRRFLNSSFNLSGSPFSSNPFFRSLTFLNCTSNLTIHTGLRQVRCLSNENYTVLAMTRSSFYDLYQAQLPCSVIGEVLVPVLWTRRSDSDTRLQWREPDCWWCEELRGTCGFKNDTDLSVACFNQERKGFPRAAKYAITLGLGMPSLVCFVGVTSCLIRRVKSPMDCGVDAFRTWNLLCRPCHNLTSLQWVWMNQQ
uniref:RING-type E3 ubiquitin transferase n=1 Tax=Rhizophora mucronata TaxID=61149 RepID=A0A2P2IKG7_RHIMU